MTSGNFTLAALSHGAAALGYGAFGLQLVRQGYLRAPRVGAALALLLAVGGSAAWGFLSLALQFQRSVLFAGLTTLADLLRYAGWYLFVLLLFRRTAPAASLPAVRWAPPVGAVVLLLAAVSQGLGILGVDVPLGTLRLIEFSWTALAVLGLMLVEQLFRNVPEDARWNVKPLCLGLAGIFVFDAYLFSQAAFFNRIDADALSVRGAVQALMLPLLLLSMARRRDWIAEIRVSRQAVFHSATLLIAGACLLLISAVGYYVRFFGGEWGGALQQILMFSALIGLTVLAVSGAVRARLRVFVGKHFFRYRYDYREEWLRFTRTLSAQHSPQEMGQRVIRGLADMLESPAGSLWLKATGSADFSQAAHWNQPEQVETESPASTFCGFLARSGWVVNLDEFHAYPERYADLELPPWLLRVPRAWLIVPLRVSDDLTGFVVLASPRTPMDVNWEVNDLLKTAGRQAASFLAQMQATEALLEVRKFDAFNRMSAFVVHDLKNIVTQLSLMMKNAQRLHANPEFQQDMLMTVENSLERMRQLMLQLREGATPAGATFGVDLAAMAERLGQTAAARGRLLDMRRVERVVARGDADRLERILGHVVQNAFDATDTSGAVWLKLDRLGGQARVEVGDTGHGMTQEFVRDRLFKPFQTTKQAGMGIGAYESFQYVQELGGKIAVDSAPGKGTLVTLLLPLFNAENDSGLDMRRAS